MRKFGLGRGLEALIPMEKETLQKIPLEKILPNPFQPRINFSETSLLELAKSIKENGVIEPIIVREKENNYELIAGERRFRAAKMVGLETIPAIIRPTSDNEALEITLLENLQREDLNPLEQAMAYERLIKDFEFTQEQIAEKIGKDRSSIANTLRLLNLPEYIKESILNGKISEGHGRALLGVENIDLQNQILKKIERDGLSVRETENLVRGLSPDKIKRKIKKKREFGEQIYLKVAEDQLQSYLATKVRIIMGEKRGIITIEYYSQEDLERILEIILKKQS